MRKIVIADSVDASRNMISDLLTAKGYTIFTASDAAGTIRLSRNIHPDLVLMDVSLKGGNAYDTAKILEDDKISSVLFMTSNPDKQLFSKLANMSLYAYVTKPVIPAQLIQLVEFSIINSSKIKTLSKKIEELEGSIEARKKIEKAKGIVIQRLKVSEEEAYKYMRKKSMDHCIPMEVLAEKILSKYK